MYATINSNVLLLQENLAKKLLAALMEAFDRDNKDTDVNTCFQEFSEAEKEKLPISFILELVDVKFVLR